MARHNEILEQFIEITPVFDYSEKSHTNLVSFFSLKHFCLLEIKFLNK